MSAFVFTVEKCFSYEGDQLCWAGTSFEDAKTFARSVVDHGAERIDVTKWLAGACLEVWSLAGDEFYGRRKLADGTWEDIT